MNVEIVSVILLVIVVAFFAVKTYFSLKGKTKKQILDELQKEAYKLFLYAQKQGWAGPDKMDWCAKQITKLFPEQIRAYVEGPIEKWLQDQYDEFQKYIADNANALGIKAE